jgi:formylglycine-generating enzyme required for sulfatase activity
MGLDMYAYVAARAGQQSDYSDGAEWNDDTKDYVNTKVNKPREIAYWRKHPNLHGWMNRLWEAKGGGGDFNGDELELTAEDLDMLEYDVVNAQLPATGGFFFGNDADEHYRKSDLEFIKNARAELFLGLKVFYNSSW